MGDAGIVLFDEEVVRAGSDAPRVLQVGPEHDQRRSLLASGVATGAGKGVDQNHIVARIRATAKDRQPGIKVLAQDRVLCQRVAVELPECVGPAHRVRLVPSPKRTLVRSPAPA